MFLHGRYVRSAVILAREQLFSRLRYALNVRQVSGEVCLNLKTYIFGENARGNCTHGNVSNVIIISTF